MWSAKGDEVVTKSSDWIAADSLNVLRYERILRPRCKEKGYRGYVVLLETMRGDRETLGGVRWARSLIFLTFNRRLEALAKTFLRDSHPPPLDSLQSSTGNRGNA